MRAVTALILNNSQIFRFYLHYVYLGHGKAAQCDLVFSVGRIVLRFTYNSVLCCITVLPRFEVSVDLPSYVLKSYQSVDFSVSAQ